MTLQELFSKMYGGCEDDWITAQLLQPCLPSWVHKDGTYDYLQAEIQRACELPEHHFKHWDKFFKQYLDLAHRRYLIHLQKRHLVLSSV